MRAQRMTHRSWTWVATTLLVAIAADPPKPRPIPSTTPIAKTGVAGTSGAAGPGLPEVIRTQEYEDVDGAARPAEAPAARATARSQAEWTGVDVDRAVDRLLAASKTAPSPPASDEAFIRRASLDLIGRPPTIAAIRQFVASRAPDKRGALVETLLADPDFGENWARYWRDVVAFRAPNESERAVNFPEFVEWLAAKFNSNVGWDKIATEIITATGRTDENGAAVFALAEEADPVELAGEVSRVFLGIQIQCAQCHDHPSDPWKREQFHEFAAFFAGIRRKRAEKPMPGQKPIFQVTNNGPTRYTMADLKDPARKIPIAPRFFLGDSPRVADQVTSEGRLKLAAAYVTGPENPWFARAFVNRIWTALVGEGFYDLVDDLGPTRTANAVDLLDALAEQWRHHDYDIRWLYRTIMTTRAYGREARSTNSAAGRTLFAANVPSRLRADQIFDALSQSLDIEQVKKRRENAPGGKGAKATGKAEGKDEDAIRKVVDHTFGVDPSTPGGDVLGTIPQALYMMNSPLVTRLVQARPGTMLGQLLAGAGTPREAIEVVYLKTLARRPNSKELATCLRYLDNAADDREAFEDILWSLINSTEFISRR